MQIKSATELLLPKTYKKIWHRGESYADAGRVKIIKLNEKEIEAIVEGRENYEVGLEFSGKGISKGCTCPYSNLGSTGRVCKHMVATAILWDEKRGIEKPSQDDTENYTMEEPEIINVGNMFSEPLKANLDKLRSMADYTGFPSKRRETHAKLPDCPKIDSDRKTPLKRKETQKVLKEMERRTNRRNYDTYFCASEMAAAFSKMLDIIEKRISCSQSKEVILSMADCVDWYFKGFNQIIDGSDGVWVFPQARIGKVVSELLGKYPQDPAWQTFRKIVQDAGNWWGEPDLDEEIIAEWKNVSL